MHGRQSTRIRSIIRSQSQCRTAATAAAVKTQVRLFDKIIEYFIIHKLILETIREMGET